MQAFFSYYWIFYNILKNKYLYQIGRTPGKGFMLRKFVRGAGALFNIF